VGLAVAANVPECRVVLGELSEGALRICKQNVRRNNLNARVTCLSVDALEPPAASLWDFDVIVSNPPYIPTADIPALSPEVHREPVAALDGGTDGMTFYHAILRDYAPLVKPGGLILLEMAYDQAEDLKRLAAEYLPEARVEILRDLGGNDRVTKITLPTP
jgi:release factor glutamine methyltransferase